MDELNLLNFQKNLSSIQKKKSEMKLKFFTEIKMKYKHFFFIKKLKYFFKNSRFDLH